MRIAQIVLPGASAYERKSQRADRAALAARHEVIVTTLAGVRGDVNIDVRGDIKVDVAHVYASGALSTRDFAGFPVPYVSSAHVQRSRWTWRKASLPCVLVTPETLPEAVEDAYFAFPLSAPPRAAGEGKIVGSYARSGTANMVEQTQMRIARFRGDVSWRTFDAEPSPADLASVDLWVDPAVEESDFDGFVAEALVVGLPVVASRTRINVQRLEQGRTGALVPPRDPNEMTHAILAALFKPEVATSKISAARQTVSKFGARQRLRVLTALYESCTKR